MKNKANLIVGFLDAAVLAIPWRKSICAEWAQKHPGWAIGLDLTAGLFAVTNLAIFGWENSDIFN